MSDITYASRTRQTAAAPQTIWFAPKDVSHLAYRWIAKDRTGGVSYLLFAAEAEVRRLRPGRQRGLPLAKLPKSPDNSFHATLPRWLVGSNDAMATVTGGERTRFARSERYPFHFVVSIQLNGPYEGPLPDSKFERHSDSSPLLSIIGRSEARLYSDRSDLSTCVTPSKLLEIAVHGDGLR
jgi:hypothetical protein